MEAPLPELPQTLEDEPLPVKAPLDAAPAISAGPAAPTAGAGAGAPEAAGAPPAPVSAAAPLGVAAPEITGAAPSTPAAAARAPAVEPSPREEAKAQMRATPSAAARDVQRGTPVGSVSPLAYYALSAACLAMAVALLGAPGLVRGGADVQTCGRAGGHVRAGRGLARAAAC